MPIVTMWSESGRNSSTHSRPKQLDDRKPENDRIFDVSTVSPALLLCPQLRTYCDIERTIETGQTRTSADVYPTASPPGADMTGSPRDVAEVPGADLRN